MNFSQLFGKRSAGGRSPTKSAGSWWLAASLAAVLSAAGLLALSPPAWADQTVADQVCLASSVASMSLERSCVPLGDWTTLRTNLNLSSSCASTTLSLVGFSGSMQSGKLTFPNTSLTPTQSGTWTLRLTTLTSGTKDLASVAVSVTSPPAPPMPLAAGSTVNIATAGAASRDMFERAVVTPNATVHIAGNVNLDLSGVENLAIAPGVKIIGDRSVYPKGPRLFTTTFPGNLLKIGTANDSSNVPADNIRISGIRFDGGSPTDPVASNNTPDEDAIEIYSSQHVEIDHNEIYGWRGFGVSEWDPQPRVGSSNANAVWVHDNYFHDIQHPSGADNHAAGYGVVMFDGAYALVEKNVFDLVRHSIAGDGRPGTGYLAYRNLFLRPGADNAGPAAVLDMHGTGCPSAPTSYDCGLAGEYMDIAYNTWTSTGGPGIGLRGTPSDPRGMSVENNVFADTAANSLRQTETGLRDNGGNQFRTTTFAHHSLSCDFDGDGMADAFAPTGSAWWYASSALNRWVYLNQSTATTGFTLSDANGDGFCDVTVDGTVFLTPGAFPSQIVLQAPSGAETVVDADGVRATASLIAPSTSPAVAHLTTGGVETAFQSASDHTLWVVDPDGNGHSTGLKMQPGTSPAIAAGGSGGWMVAAQADTSRLWTLDSAGSLVQTPSAMNITTSPAIANMPTGGYKIAFAASSNMLWIQSAGISGATGFNTGAPAATTPAIAVNGNSQWQVVVQNPSNKRMWSINEAGPKDIGVTMAAGAVPSIAALSNGGFLIAFQGPDGYLWRSGVTGGAGWIGNGLGVAPGTAPVIAASSKGRWQVAFHAQGDHLWTVDNTGTTSETDTGQLVAAGTSPAIAGLRAP